MTDRIAAKHRWRHTIQIKEKIISRFQCSGRHLTIIIRDFRNKMSLSGNNTYSIITAKLVIEVYIDMIHI
jgi:hypothetical protein